MGKAITAKVSIDQHSTSSDSSHRDLPGVTPEEYHCPSTTGRRERGLARRPYQGILVEPTICIPLGQTSHSWSQGLHMESLTSIFLLSPFIKQMWRVPTHVQDEEGGHKNV